MKLFPDFSIVLQTGSDSQGTFSLHVMVTFINNKLQDKRYGEDTPIRQIS